MQKLLFILLFITTSLYAKVEMVRSYYESGELFSEQQYVDGIQDGTANIFYKNGNLKKQTIYKDDKQNGMDTMFYKNGNIETQTKYKDGQPTKERKDFYENGDIIVIVNEKEGSFYPEGKDFIIKFKVERGDNDFFISGVDFNDKNQKDAHIKVKQDEISMEFDVKDAQIDGLLIISDSANGTEKTEYKNGKKDGVSKYYRDDKIYKQIEHRDNKKEGLTKEYYPDGSLKTKVYYKNNKPDKELISYSKDGLITSKIVIHDNNQTTKYIYNENGDLLSSYSIDIDNASIPTYNDRNYNINRDKSNPNQVYKLYYSDGSLREEINITSNKGEARGYYRDGKLRYIIPYIKQYASGEAQYFDRNKTLIASIEFKNNGKSGITKVYYHDSNKTIKYRFNYHYNSLDGIKTKYLKDGTVDYNITYSNNHIAPIKSISYRESNVSRVCYYENNNTEYNISIQNSAKSVIKHYYPNGDIEFEIHYINDEKNGTTSIYYGQREFDDVVGFYAYDIDKEPKVTPHTLRTELEFISNRLDGTTKVYNTDGNLIEEIEYKNSLRHGMSINYSNDKIETPYIDGKKDGNELHYKDGQLSEETRYKNGKKDGLNRIYYTDGKIFIEESYKDGKKDGYYRLILRDGEVYFEHLYKDGERVLEREIVEE